MLTTPLAAQARTVGVHSGDWFKYEVTLSWNSTTPPSSHSLYNMLIEIQWVKVQVTGVSGTNVTRQTTWHYQNESETTYNCWVDLVTGNGGSAPFYSLSGFFIAADLGLGDVTYTSQNIMTITSTTSRTYPNSTRTTSYAQYAVAGMFVEDYYWDKSTGAMVELDVNSAAQQGADTVAILGKFILIDSGSWVVPEFSPMLLLTLFATLTLAAVAYKRRQPKVKKIIEVPHKHSKLGKKYSPQTIFV